jgi:hypothetical protein
MDVSRLFHPFIALGIAPKRIRAAGVRPMRVGLLKPPSERYPPSGKAAVGMKTGSGGSKASGSTIAFGTGEREWALLRWVRRVELRVDS